MRDLQQLVDAADVEALLLAVDGLCASRDWDALADLADRCRAAVELGRQLWPVAMHIDYRLAWEGPARHAAAVLRPGAGRFALGPLTEVAASTHDWASLCPHLTDPASTAVVAQERVLRGEDLTDWAGELTSELPLRLLRWEPRYALPVYRDRSAEFPQPAAGSSESGGGRLSAVTAAAGVARLPDDPAARALRDTVEVWVAQSSGATSSVVVAGGAADAVAALLREREGSTGRRRSPAAVLTPLSAADGLALLQWAAASGGAYGRRRGGAGGRFSAWWAAAALAGIDWPGDAGEAGGFADELGEAVADLRWHRWWREEAEVGWVLRLAVEDPADGLAWAVEAVDRREEGAPA